MANVDHGAGTTDLPLDTERVLKEEAAAIHGAAAAGIERTSGTELYRALNGLGSAALCLSGGGIRSAAFALGVIQALAVNPRPAAAVTAQAAGVAPPGPDADRHRHAGPDECLLSGFHYISTVSGGGYIGSWLTAGVARTSFADMWRKLVDRTPRPEDESPQIAWLRAYSNYLTPRLGLGSADTWTAIALYIRNLVLNWLVIIPVLLAALIVIKLTVAAAAFGFTGVGLATVVAIALIGGVLQVSALRFALLHRPTRPVRRSAAVAAVFDTAQEAAQDAAQAENRGEQQTDERAQAIGRGADQRRFLRWDLMPSVLAAFAFTLSFWPKVVDPILEWPLWKLAAIGACLGIVLYATAWIVAWPWPARDKERRAAYWATDFWQWSLAGGVYGAIIGFGVYLYTYDLDLLVGYIPLTEQAKNAFLLFIYGVPWVITAQLTAEMIFVGLSSWQINSDADREWFGRSTGWFTAVAVCWGVVGFMVLVGSGLLFLLFAMSGSYIAKISGSMSGIAAGAVTAILGRSSASPARKGSARKSWTGLILGITTPIFIASLVIGFSASLDNLLLGHPFHQSPLIGGIVEAAPDVLPAEAPAPPAGVPAAPAAGPASAPAATPNAAADASLGGDAGQDLLWLLIGLAAAAIVAWIASKNVNVNRFSLHALYRNRLIRAFLGATNPGRNPDSFTGFDERDNPAMTALWSQGRTPKRLFHVINMALNVVSSQRLAWQERKAESFTVSPLHSGSAYKAYRRSAEYANGMSLGTAVAISGAAASPNMGYHSSPAVTLLLALFNVRLGWWLGNPGPEGNATYRSEGPLTAIKPLLDEMLGQTTDRNAYIYVSDGGHFENLGLYEMVRRRCRFIVVSDAGCDKEFRFEDLGNAVRKIWLDLGIRITFAGLNALRYRAKRNGVYGKFDPPFQAIGTIDYPAADGTGSQKGIILYIKPSFHRNRIENVGVRNYATLNADFPHQSTADQFFSESQFESYRALGFEMTDDILRQALGSGLGAGATMQDIFDRMPGTAAPGP